MSALEKPEPLDNDTLPELSQTAMTAAGQLTGHDPDDVSPGARPALESIFDVPVKVSVVLGKTKMDVASLMKLGAGAIIELDRTVGDPIDLYVNDRLIARGELVMVDGSLGVTMTEIVKDNEI